MSSLYSIGDDVTFIPASYTIFNWGDQAVPGVAGPPEVNAYLNYPYQSSMNPFVLNKTQIEDMLAAGYSWYGFTNNFNMMRLYTEYANAYTRGLVPSAYWTGAAAQLGIT